MHTNAQSTVKQHGLDPFGHDLHQAGHARSDAEATNTGTTEGPGGDAWPRNTAMKRPMKIMTSPS